MHCGWTVSLIVLREGGTEPRAGDEQKGICFLYSLKVVCMGCTCYRRCVHHGTCGEDSFQRLVLFFYCGDSED